MTYFPVLALLALAPVQEKATNKPLLVRDLLDNAKARLTGARISETRGRILFARFEILEKVPRVVVMNFPAHSFTTHEQTLRAVIESCTDLHGAGLGDDGWRRPRWEAIFSVPKEGAGRDSGRYSDLERIYLLAILPEKEKK